MEAERNETERRSCLKFHIEELSTEWSVTYIKQQFPQPQTMC